MMENEYSKALNKFILGMVKLPPVLGHPDVNALSEDLCRILRISRLEVLMCTPPKSMSSDKYEFTGGVLFTDGKPDKNRAYRLEKVVGDGSRAEYTVCPYTDADDWTDDEKEKIEVFVKTLFVFQGRTRLMNIAESYLYTDTELGVNNLNYFIRQCTELMNNDLISDCICCRFNLKRFAYVNRRLGRDVGTEVMRKYILNLTELVGDRGIVCRIGGDKFIALFPNEKAEEVKNYLLETTVETGVSGLENITLNARAGYCPITSDCRLFTNIMDRVTAAESIVNTNPSLPYVYYDDETRHRTETAKWIEGMFADAVKDEEFMVYYQPKVNLNDFSIIGAEALCRWKHKGDIIQPSKFIPIFEQSNYICVLDFYMLEHICQDIRRWIDEGKPVVKISAHMSRVSLGSKDLAERIIEIINRYNVPKEYIEIELKETTTDVDFIELKRVVSALHKEGISASVDSFGVRYSSLNLIREMPWKVLKLDKSLVKDEGGVDGQKHVMLKYVISLAHALGLECIAEGVETAEQVELLKENGCFKAQGFYFDKPLPVKKFEERLSTEKPYSTGAVEAKPKAGSGDVEFFDELL